jgi:NTE family protein
MRDRLLPFAVSEEAFETWRRTRQARRLKELPTPTFIEAEGFVTSDSKRLDTLLARHIGVPLNMNTLEADIAIVAGLDRYETVTWRMVRDGAGAYGLSVRGRAKSYAPPFMMLGLTLENTTSTDFNIAASARYLAFDTVGSGSEWRIDGTVGSNPAFATELYRPIGSKQFFVAPYAAIGRRTFNVISDDSVIARYRQDISRLGANLGVNFGAQSDVRVGAYVGRRAASITVGDPGFPELSGKETGAEIAWRLDTQDSPVVPSRGILSRVLLSRIFDGPNVDVNGEPVEFSSQVTQLSGTANQFWSKGPRNRLFLYGGLGTSFGDVPLPTDQFSLGMPFRLGAYDTGEIIGSNYYVATGGYLRQIGRLPDFMGGPIFAGGWLENGDAFDEWSLAKWRTNGGVGVVMDTLVGPVVIAGAWGFDGRWRTYVAVGRAFR